ncbi:MAG: DegV family protein, partial [Acidimicrobiia bacterium]
DLSAIEFWDRLVAAEALPTTAAPSVGAFQQAYKRLAADGAEGIVAVTISAELSATHQSAQLATEGAPVPVTVVDSGTASIPLGLTAIAAADAARLGADLSDVTTAVTGMDSDLLATLDTLEHLQKGGRIGAAQAFFGGLLNVKPLITFTDGAVAAAGRVRTRRKALAALFEWLAVQKGVVRAGVVHGNAPEIDDVVAQAKQLLPDVDPIVSLAGPVIGTHAGPGVIGIAVTRS